MVRCRGAAWARTKTIKKDMGFILESLGYSPALFVAYRVGRPSHQRDRWTRARPESSFGGGMNVMMEVSKEDDHQSYRAPKAKDSAESSAVLYPSNWCW
jgi:hypothetical protein